MEIIIKGGPKELAVLALAVQGRQAEDVAEIVGAEFVKKLHQEIKNQLEAIRSYQESR